MQLRKILIALFLVITGPFVLADEGGSISSEKSEAVGHHHEGDHHEEAHMLPPAAPVIFEVGPMKITNSMFVTFIVALGIIIIAQMATSNIQLIPSGLQNFVELLVESLYGFFESIIGTHMVKRTFWFFGTTFIFILFANWFDGRLIAIGSVVSDAGTIIFPITFILFVNCFLTIRLLLWIGANAPKFLTIRR